MDQRSPFQGSRATIDFENLLDAWDSLFLETVDPTRDERMEAIVAVLGDRLRGPFRVLELGTGPGPLTRRILGRFRSAKLVGLDSDPVLLRVGEQALKRYRRRATWVLADLRERTWSSTLPDLRFDAVASSLALHWLHKHEIRRLYRDLRGLLRPGGLLVNGDFLPSEPRQREQGSQGDRRDGSRRSGVRESRLRAFRPKWAKWWRAIEREPTLRRAVQERQIRMPGPLPPRRSWGPKMPVSLECHRRGLRDAGFREASVSWRDGEFRVLVGVR